MDDSFKCGSCGHDKAHSVGGSDRIMVIRNPHLNAYTTFKVCEKCNILHAFWGKFTEDKDIAKEKRQAVSKVLKENLDKSDDDLSP